MRFSLLYDVREKRGFCVRAFVFLFSCLGCPTLSYGTELSKFSNFLPYTIGLLCVCVVVVSLEEKDDDDEFKEEIRTKR